MNKISISGTEFNIVQSKLRKWLTLEDIKETVFEAVEHKDSDNVALSICLYVSTAFDITKDTTQNASWMEIVIAFREQVLVDQIDTSDLACMKVHDKLPETKVSWEYVGRSWWKWADIFANRYHWSLETLADLSITDATHLMQEVFVDEQFKKEWEWLLSERCFVWDEASKKSKFKELERPKWMSKVETLTVKHAKPEIKIPIDMLPVGNIIHGSNKP